MGDQFFGGDVEKGWNHVLEPLGLDVATLRSHPEGIYRPLRQQEKQYACATPNGPRGFATEARRVEFYSEKLHRYGYPAVPHYVPPSRGEAARAAERRRFPYTLTSSRTATTATASIVARKLPFVAVPLIPSRN